MRKSGRSVRFSLRAEYLTYLGVKDIVFEPDGNVSPDFVVNGKIAIEVRRLNQHYSDKSGKPEGLEQLAMPLRQRLETLLRMLGPPTNNLSWWVSYRFKRPQLTRNWEVAVREKLQAFQSATLKADEGVIEIDRNFRLSRTFSDNRTVTDCWDWIYGIFAVQSTGYSLYRCRDLQQL